MRTRRRPTPRSCVSCRAWRIVIDGRGDRGRDHHHAGTACETGRASARERPVCSRHRVRVGRYVRADLVLVAACDARTSRGDRSARRSRPGPAVGPGERSIDRSRDARRRRGPANLPLEDRDASAAGFRRSDRGRAWSGSATRCRSSIWFIKCSPRSLSGSETRTDWRHRPLSPAQLEYALDDVRYLLDLADHFSARLAQLGRTEWAEGEFRGSRPFGSAARGRRSLAAAARA